MIKTNLPKEDAKKIDYYDNGDFVKDFKNTFLKITMRERDEVTKSFEGLIKLIEGIQNQPS